MQFCQISQEIEFGRLFCFSPFADDRDPPSKVRQVSSSPFLILPTTLVEVAHLSSFQAPSASSPFWLSSFFFDPLVLVSSWAPQPLGVAMPLSALTQLWLAELGSSSSQLIIQFRRFFRERGQDLIERRFSTHFGQYELVRLQALLSSNPYSPLQSAFSVQSECYEDHLCFQSFLPCL